MRVKNCFKLKRVGVLYDYAAWNNLILSKKQFTDEDIVTEARENWHKLKLQIPREKFINAIKWMKKNKLLIPKGNGKIVVAK